MPKCPHCDKVIERNDTFNRHIKSIHSDFKYKCELCDFVSQWKDKLKRHVDSVHNHPQYKCELCDFVSQRKDMLKRHLDSVHNHSEYKCELCEFTSKRKDMIKRHVESLHKVTKFECEHCNFVGNRKDNLKRHILIKHGGASAAAVPSPKDYRIYRVEPEMKKRRLEEEDLWGGSLTASDIEQLPVEPTVEEDLWGGSLTASDLELLAVESTVGEDLWGGSLTSADVEMLSEIPVKETIEPEPEKERGRKILREGGATTERELGRESDREVRRQSPKEATIEPEPEKERGRKRDREDNGRRERELWRGLERGEKRKRDDEDESEEESSDMSVKSAFKEKMVERAWKVRGFKDPIGALNNYKESVKSKLFNTLLNKNVPMKWYVTIKVIFYKFDNSTRNKTEDSAFFHGGMQTLLAKEDFEESYQSSINKIWKSFDEYLKNGSGWILERVEQVLLNTYLYRPINISSYVPTPTAIAGKHAIRNIQNENDKKCFEYSMLAALHKDEIEEKHAERPSQYRQFMGQLKGCKEPMTLNDIKHFERLNDIPVAVYRIEHDGSQIYPLYMSKSRDKEPINLLMIQGQEHYHFAWIKNFNKLLRPKGSKHAKVYCPYCCYGYVKSRHGDFNLANHKVHCRPHGPQRTQYLPEGENFVEFKEFRKMQKMPFTIYADFECLNTSIGDDILYSGMNLKTNHEVSGFTFYTVSDYFPPNIVSYRGEDAGQVFLEKIQLEKRRLLNVIKEIKEMNLTSTEENAFQKSTSCKICKNLFEGISDPKGPKVRDHCHFTGKNSLHKIQNTIVKILQENSEVQHTENAIWR